MSKTPQEVTAKAREIYELAKSSSTPLSVLSQANTSLMRESGWGLLDIERVAVEVMEMLIAHGWDQFTKSIGDSEASVDPAPENI
jgi:hypothetical protein